MSIIVKQNQCLFDVTILETGSSMSAFDWALANGISVTDELQPRAELTNPNSSYKNEVIANFYKDRNQNLGTAVKAEPAPEPIEIDHQFPQGEFAISF